MTIALKPGQISVHDIGLIHGSRPNMSPRRRAGLAIRYISPTAHIHRKLPSAAADWTTMPMEVVRGVNRNARNDFAVGDLGRGWVDAKRSGSPAITQLLPGHPPWNKFCSVD